MCYYCLALTAQQKNQFKMIKSYVLLVHVNERCIKHTVIKKANQFASFTIGDIHLFDFKKFLVGSTSPDSFLKAYKTNNANGFSPIECFDRTEKMNKKNCSVKLLVHKTHCVQQQPLKRIVTTFKTLLRVVYLPSKV